MAPDTSEHDWDLLRWLGPAVAAHVLALRRRPGGGPNHADLRRVAAYDLEIAALPEAQEGKQARKDWEAAMEQLAEAIAVLAFRPDGIDLFGVHWEVCDGQ